MVTTKFYFSEKYHLTSLIQPKYTSTHKTNFHQVEIAI